MRSKCERCNGDFAVWDERITLAMFAGSVRAQTCNACHNEIVKMIQSSALWAKGSELNANAAVIEQAIKNGASDIREAARDQRDAVHS